VAPGLDDKVLTSWNALMLAAFAECGAAMGRSDWLAIARKNAGFLLSSLQSGGRLLRTWKADSNGGGARLNGYLEDYAFLVNALLALYESTFENRWFEEAKRLADEMIALFWAPEEAIFFDTGHDHEQLLFRPRDTFDSALPSGGSAAAMALLRLTIFTDDGGYQDKAVRSLTSVRDLMERAPQGFANWLSAVDFYLARRKEVVVIGSSGDPATKALLGVARKGYWPNHILAGAESAGQGIDSPLLQERGPVDGRPAAYVCENYACQLPVTTPEALAAQLGQ
jgi:hypothetical protein